MEKFKVSCKKNYNNPFPIFYILGMLSRLFVYAQCFKIYFNYGIVFLKILSDFWMFSMFLRDHYAFRNNQTSAMFRFFRTFTFISLIYSGRHN